MDIAPNHVLVHEGQFDLGPFVAETYANIVDADLTATFILPRLLTWELQGYLNQYFPGWRLLRRVEEIRRHPTANPYKKVCYVIAVETDADAETVRSHLVKIDYDPLKLFPKIR